MEIFYVEDDEDIARSVRQYLVQNDYCVSVYPTIQEAKEALTADRPSLVLLDWNMPDGQGSTLCKWIRDSCKDLPVIFLTVRGDSKDIVDGFACGADDYVVKPFALEVLLSRMQAVLRRTGDTSTRYLSCYGIILDREGMHVRCGEEEIALSPSEYRLLLLLMENKGRILKREQILEALWDVEGNFVNDNTLTVTLKRLREKLHQPACIKTVRSISYRMEETICRKENRRTENK